MIVIVIVVFDVNSNVDVGATVDVVFDSADRWCAAVGVNVKVHGGADVHVHVQVNDYADVNDHANDNDHVCDKALKKN